MAWATLNKLWPVETWRYLQSRVERYRSTVESLVKPTHSCGMPLEEMEQTAFFALKVKAKPPRPPPPLSPSLPESLSLCGTLPTPNRPDCYCLENTTLPCGREFPSVLDAGVYLQITKKMLQPLVSVCVESDFFFLVGQTGQTWVDVLCPMLCYVQIWLNGTVVLHARLCHVSNKHTQVSVLSYREGLHFIYLWTRHLVRWLREIYRSVRYIWSDT